MHAGGTTRHRETQLARAVVGRELHARDRADLRELVAGALQRCEIFFADVVADAVELVVVESGEQRDRRTFRRAHALELRVVPTAHRLSSIARDAHRGEERVRRRIVGLEHARVVLAIGVARVHDTFERGRDATRSGEVVVLRRIAQLEVARQRGHHLLEVLQQIGAVLGHEVQAGSGHRGLPSMTAADGSGCSLKFGRTRVPC